MFHFLKELSFTFRKGQPVTCSQDHLTRKTGRFPQTSVWQKDRDHLVTMSHVIKSSDLLLLPLTSNFQTSSPRLSYSYMRCQQWGLTTPDLRPPSFSFFLLIGREVVTWERFCAVIGWWESCCVSVVVKSSLFYFENHRIKQTIKLNSMLTSLISIII